MDAANQWTERALRGVCFAVLGLAGLGGSPLAAQTGAEPLAPDGHRGLGATTELGDVLKVLRGRKDEDRIFIDRLDALVAELGTLTGELSEHYAARGGFDLVPTPAEPAAPAESGQHAKGGEPAPPALAELHAAFLEAAGHPLAVLARKDDTARAFAELYLDTRFRARLAVLAQYEIELAEFRAGLAVLRGAGDGWIDLNPTEVQNIITRVDLSTSYLRAMKKDLEVLRPKPEEATDPAAVTALLSAAHARDEVLRRAAFGAIAELGEERLARMVSTLFTGRFADSPEARAQVDWRTRMRTRAEPLRAEALIYLPGTEESEALPPEIVSMRKTDRLRWAERRAVEGLAFDPIDEQMVFVAAHCSDFLWGDIQSRPYYDRYLALRGIRAHDDNTIRGRDLTERELEALTVVQRPFLPGQRPKTRGPDKTKE